MSIIDKKPFINKVLESMTAEDLATLRGLINGGGIGPVFKSLNPNASSVNLLSVADKGVKEIELELYGSISQRLYNGYLVYNDSYCVLISYSAKKEQTLTLIKIEYNSQNKRWEFKIMPCEITILELRSELDDSSAAEKAEIRETVEEMLEEGTLKIQADNVDSEEQDAGKVLMADGEGGAEWGEVDLSGKADKVGELPHYTVATTDGILDFLNSNDVSGKPIVLDVGGMIWVCRFSYDFSLGNDVAIKIITLESQSFIGSVSLSANDNFIYLYNLLTDLEKVSNKVTALSSGSTNVQYPTAKCVYDIVTAIKRDSYVPVDTTTYPTLNDFLASTGEEGYMYLYPIDTSDLTKGYYRYIWENGAWVDLGTTQIDLSGYYAKNQSLIPTETNTYDLGSSTYTFKDLYLSGSICLDGSATQYIKYGNTNYIGFSSSAIYVNKKLSTDTIEPQTDNASNLGSSSKKWKNLYLVGNLSDGTNAFTIAHAYKILDGVTNSTALSFETILEASVSANASYTFPVISAGTQPEAKAIITNSGASTITLTFDNVSKCLCNDDNAVITSTENALTHMWTTTITMGAGVTYEISIVAGKMVVVNFEAQ